MMRAASEFNLELAHFGGATPGIGVWDGTQFVWQSTNNDTADNISMADRYKDGPVISGELYVIHFPIESNQVQPGDQGRQVLVVVCQVV